MRVDAARKSGYAASAAPARRGAGAGFSVAEGEAPSAPAAASTPRAVTSLGALIALQSIEDPAEKRSRAVKRGRAALDALDEIKLGLLAGDLDGAALARLKAAAAGMAEISGDSGLDSVLAQVELRAAVELAKLSRNPRGQV
jgi:hypothetical protein